MVLADLGTLGNGGRNMMLRNKFIAGLLCAGVAACGADDTDSQKSDDTGAHKLDEQGNAKADAWDYRNDPEGLARFATEEHLEYTLDKLPKKALLRNAAWTDTYWPTYQDSTNVQWQGQGTLSPMQKYDAAFNGWQIPANFAELRPYNPARCEDGFQPGSRATVTDQSTRRPTPPAPP